MGKVDVLLGLQWGDEGKGKFVDVLAPRYNIVARFQGGPNAGHTLEFDGKRCVLHTVPSGIFHDHVMNVIGNGVVVEPVIFQREIDSIIEKFGLSGDSLRSRLLISDKAKLILPTHRLLDKAREMCKGKQKIGSTLKGIGPAYEDDKGRIGLRVGNIFDDDFFEKVKALHGKHAKLIDDMEFVDLDSDIDGIPFLDYYESWTQSINFLKTFQIIQTEYYLNEALDAGEKVLAEGAQGTLLDIEFGTYPMVTTSNVISGGVCTGLGIAPNRIGEVFGVFKAYTTRVGNGPFPTELYHENDEKFQNQDGEFMAKFGKEYGATTGRPRRCGWLDLPALRYACMINGVTQLLIPKVDVLSSCNGFNTIKVAVAYKFNGKKTTKFDVNQLGNYIPVYKEFLSWPALDSIAKNLNDIPDELAIYLSWLEHELKILISMVSIGPDRNQVLTDFAECEVCE